MRVRRRLPCCLSRGEACQYRVVCLQQGMQQRLLPWPYQMVPGTHQLCAKLQNHYSRGWMLVGRALYHHFLHSTPKPWCTFNPESSQYNQQLGLLPWACQKLSARLIWAKTSRPHSMSPSPSTSPSTHISKPATIGYYKHMIGVAFL